MSTATLTRPDIKVGNAMHIAGFRHLYKRDEMATSVPGQWQLLRPYFGSLPGRVGKSSYGIVCSDDQKTSVEYMCGIEVSDFATIPPELDHLQVPRQTYAVFAHEGHVSTLSETWQMIWEEWYPRSDYKAANSPDFERYDETYNPASGVGGIEIWFPVTKAQ